MGMFRDADSLDADLVKEMAEALGSTGMRLEELLQEIEGVRRELDQLMDSYGATVPSVVNADISAINEGIRKHNRLVDKAEDALRWLLIQREACGFRRHRDVHLHYPIPAKMKLLKS